MSDSTPTLERVAAAIHGAAYDCPPWEGETDTMKEGFRKMARAALDASGNDEALREIGSHVAWWLRYTREYGKIEVTPDTHIVPPCWPSYGQLCNWLDHLNPALATEARAAIARTQEQSRHD